MPKEIYKWKILVCFFETPNPIFKETSKKKVIANFCKWTIHNCHGRPIWMHVKGAKRPRRSFLVFCRVFFSEISAELSSGADPVDSSCVISVDPSKIPKVTSLEIRECNFLTVSEGSSGEITEETSRGSTEGIYWIISERTSWAILKIFLKESHYFRK